MDLRPITPDTRPKTEQEVFDYVVRFLRRQGRQAMFDGCCVYRAEDGAKCAAGCLIPDSEYGLEFETGSLDRGDVVDDYFREHYGFAWELLCELQGTHDHEEDPSMWEHWWARTARERGLTMPEIGQ